MPALVAGIQSTSRRDTRGTRDWLAVPSTARTKRAGRPGGHPRRAGAVHGRSDAHRQAVTFVMPALVAGIQSTSRRDTRGTLDGRDEHGHDEARRTALLPSPTRWCRTWAE